MFLWLWPAPGWSQTTRNMALNGFWEVDLVSGNLRAWQRQAASCSVIKKCKLGNFVSKQKKSLHPDSASRPCICAVETLKYHFMIHEYVNMLACVCTCIYTYTCWRWSWLVQGYQRHVACCNSRVSFMWHLNQVECGILYQFVLEKVLCATCIFERGDRNSLVFLSPIVCIKVH